MTASILDYAPHSPSQLRYNPLFKPGFSLSKFRFANLDVEAGRTSAHIREMPLSSPSSTSYDLIPDRAFGNIDRLTVLTEDLAGNQVRASARGERIPTRRPITAVRSRAGITKTNGKNRDFSLVVKDRAV